MARFASKNYSTDLATRTARALRVPSVIISRGAGDLIHVAAAMLIRLRIHCANRAQLNFRVLS